MGGASLQPCPQTLPPHLRGERTRVDKAKQQRQLLLWLAPLPSPDPRLRVCPGWSSTVCARHTPACRCVVTRTRKGGRGLQVRVGATTEGRPSRAGLPGSLAPLRLSGALEPGSSPSDSADRRTEETLRKRSEPPPPPERARCNSSGRVAGSRYFSYPLLLPVLSRAFSGSPGRVVWAFPSAAASLLSILRNV